jgi:hypothetical protein
MPLKKWRIERNLSATDPDQNRQEQDANSHPFCLVNLKCCCLGLLLFEVYSLFLLKETFSNFLSEWGETVKVESYPTLEQIDTFASSDKF